MVVDIWPPRSSPKRDCRATGNPSSRVLAGGEVPRGPYRSLVNRVDNLKLPPYRPYIAFIWTPLSLSSPLKLPLTSSVAVVIGGSDKGPEPWAPSYRLGALGTWRSQIQRADPVKLGATNGERELLMSDRRESEKFSAPLGGRALGPNGRSLASGRGTSNQQGRKRQKALNTRKKTQEFRVHARAVRQLLLTVTIPQSRVTQSLGCYSWVPTYWLYYWLQPYHIDD